MLNVFMWSRDHDVTVFDTHNCNNSNNVDILCINFAKVFDTVPHN